MFDGLKYVTKSPTTDVYFPQICEMKLALWWWNIIWYFRLCF